MAEGPRLRLRPILRLPYRAGRALVSIAFDRAFGVETTRLVNELTIRPGRPPLFEHIPVGWLTMWRILRRLRISAADVFNDIGAGNGRALLIASRFPFRRLVGIGLSPDLHAKALRNLATCRNRPAMSGELLHGDALVEPFPADAMVVFFFNSFDGVPLHPPAAPHPGGGGRCAAAPALRLREPGRSRPTDRHGPLAVGRPSGRSAPDPRVGSAVGHAYPRGRADMRGDLAAGLDRAPLTATPSCRPSLVTFRGIG